VNVGVCGCVYVILCDVYFTLPIILVDNFVLFFLYFLLFLLNSK